jgi:hypothetical protein
MRHDSSSILELDGKEVSVFTPSQPREKWQRKRTHVKLRVRVLWLPLKSCLALMEAPSLTEEAEWQRGALFLPTLCVWGWSC